MRQGGVVRLLRFILLVFDCCSGVWQGLKCHVLDLQSKTSAVLKSGVLSLALVWIVSADCCLCFCCCLDWKRLLLLFFVLFLFLYLGNRVGGVEPHLVCVHPLCCKKVSVAILYVSLFLQCNVCVVAFVDKRMKIRWATTIFFQHT